MQFTAHLALLLLLLQTLPPLADSQQVERPSTCHAGDFGKCESASVQCIFNRDLNLTKHNFNVVHYDFDSDSSDSGTYVLLCNWQQHVQTPECKVEDGYTFNYVVSDRLTLGIPDVTTKVEGKYACQLVPHNGTTSETCTLTVSDSNPTPTPKETLQAGFTDNRSLIIALLALVAIFLVVFSVYVVVRFSCQGGKRSWDTGPPSGCIPCGQTCCVDVRANSRDEVRKVEEEEYEGVSLTSSGKTGTDRRTTDNKATPCKQGDDTQSKNAGNEAKLSVKPRSAGVKRNAGERYKKAAEDKTIVGDQPPDGHQGGTDHKEPVAIRSTSASSAVPMDTAKKHHYDKKTRRITARTTKTLSESIDIATEALDELEEEDKRRCYIM